MTRGEQAVARGRALIGTRFVAQGRDPANGLDCVGLVLHAFGIDAGRVRDDYRLRGSYRAAILAAAARDFRRVARTRRRAGDLLLLRPGIEQWHLGLWTGSGILHADVASRRIVERPGLPGWPVAAVLRPRRRVKEG